MRCGYLAMVVGLGLLGAADTGGQAAKGPQWLTDIEAARAAARATGRPIFAVLRCRH
jgi:hypothetical protein